MSPERQAFERDCTEAAAGVARKHGVNDVEPDGVFDHAYLDDMDAALREVKRRHGVPE